MARNLIIFGVLLSLVVVAAFLYGQSLRQDAIVTELVPVALPPAIVEAREAFDDGDLDRAQSLLERIGADDTAFLIATQQLAMVHVRRGDLPAARDALERAIVLAPADPGLQLDLSGVLFRERDYAGAESAVLRALEIRPGAMRAVYKVGLYRVAQGRLPEGIDAYHRAISSHGSVADVEYGLGELMRLREDRPELPGVYYATAFFARTLGHVDLEIESLERFIELESDGATAEQARRALERARQASAG